MKKNLEIIRETIRNSKKPITQSQISRKTGIGIIEVVDTTERLEKRGVLVSR